jgi:hypothetical protein
MEEGIEKKFAAHRKLTNGPEKLGSKKKSGKIKTGNTGKV